MSHLGRPRALATTVCFVVSEYGMVEAEVSDPDGHRICFGQDL